jgi:hypothetical protein
MASWKKRVPVATLEVRVLEYYPRKNASEVSSRRRR